MPQPKGFEPVADWEIELLYVLNPMYTGNTPLYVETVREHHFDPILTGNY